MGISLPVRLHAATAAVAALVTASLFAAPLSAIADTAPPPGVPASTVSTDALPTVQVDGVVWAQAVVGNTVFVGGEFTTARPAGAAAGVATTARRNFLAYDVRTGNLITSIDLAFNAQVRGMAASPDRSRLYVVGNFTSVNGQARYRVAAIDTATGALLTFSPGANSAVYSVAATDSTVYLGGAFTTMNNTTRSRVAAVSASSAALLPWNPQVPDNYVRGIAVAPDLSKVVLAGGFTSLNGSTKPGRGFGAVDPTTGASLPWAAGELIYNAGDKAALYSMSSDADGVYAVGYVFGSLADGNLEGTVFAGWDGAIRWVEDCHGDSYAAAPLGDAVYVASHAHYCGNIGGFPQTQPWTFQRGMAFSKAATGTISADPLGYYNFAGTPAPSVLTWYPDINTGTYTGQSQGAWSVAAGGDYVVFGGEFTQINGQPQQGLVRFGMPSVAPNDDGPRLSGANFTPRAVSLSAGTARLNWRANYDRDNEVLTYDVIRNGDVARPVYTTTARSRIWFDRPTLSFTDTGLTPGQTYQYRLRATDPFGNSVLGDTVSVTVAASARPYPEAVLNDGASGYWRLGEGSGSTVVDWTGGGGQVAAAGVTRGAAGAIAGDSDTASTFSGTATGFASTRDIIEGPQTFSVEAWIKTTTTTGGKIVGFGNRPTGLSSSYDRQLYMDGSGRVLFGVYPGAARTLASDAGLNDGKWHYVVGTLGANGMQLFVDGALVGQRADTTSAQAYQGYWRIGGDSPWAGDAWFDGSIDEVAVYPSALTAETVARHNEIGRGTFNAPPVASFTATADDLAVAFDAGASTDSDGTIASYVWDFGDGSAAGSGATASRTYTAAGTYTVSLTVTDNRGATATTTRSVTVTAPNTLPTAAFTLQASGPTIAVDAAGSTDPDGSIASYAWSWGDGTPAGSGATATHTFAASGTFPVTLTVTDDRGGTTSTTRSVTVTVPNNAPVAAFASSTAGLTASFDASSSTDSDGTVASYRWQFGDGAEGTGVTTTYTYASAGTYPVTLTVTDDDGATAVRTTSVTVSPAPQPSADLVRDAFERNVSAGLGSAPTGGAWTMSTNSGVSVSGGVARLSTPRGWTVTGNLTSVSSTDTEVRVTTQMLQVPTVGSTFQSVIGRAVGATDYRARVIVAPNGSRVNLEINRGSTVLQGSTVPGLTYAVGDELQVRLQVFGTSPTTIRAKVWKAGSAEPAAWQVSRTDATANLQTAGSIGVGTYLGSSATPSPTVITFDDLWAGPTAAQPGAANAAPTATFATSANGLALTVDGAASTDPDGTISSYAWDWGDNTAAGSGATAAHTYAAAGTYPVTLTVTDDRGATNSTTRSVTVTAPAPEPANAKPVAEFTATAVNLTASVDGRGSTDSDGTIAAYAWNWGDGTAAGSGATATHPYAAAGTYQVTLTVTDDKGATTAVTKPVTVTAAPAPQPDQPVSDLARDDFERVVANGFGAAPSGGPWTLTGSAASFAVNDGSGSVNVARGSTLRASLGAVSSTATDVQTVLTVPQAATGGNLYAGVIGRSVGAAYYQSRVVIAPSGQVNLELNRSGAYLQGIVVPGLTYVAGDQLRLRFQVTGTSPTTLRATVWKVGTPEPTAWQITRTDAADGLQSAGAVGLMVYLGGAATPSPVAIRVDDFTVGTPAG